MAARCVGCRPCELTTRPTPIPLTVLYALPRRDVAETLGTNRAPTSLLLRRSR